jgi:hypothetical protein
MALLDRPRRGRPPKPRLLLTPEFVAHLRACGQPGWKLVVVAGFPHYPRFSRLIHTRIVPAESVNVERFYRLADAVDWPRAQVFSNAPEERR